MILAIGDQTPPFKTVTLSTACGLDYETIDCLEKLDQNPNTLVYFYTAPISHGGTPTLFLYQS